MTEMRARRPGKRTRPPSAAFRASRARTDYASRREAPAALRQVQVPFGGSLVQARTLPLSPCHTPPLWSWMSHLRMRMDHRVSGGVKMPPKCGGDGSFAALTNSKLCLRLLRGRPVAVLS